MSQDHRKNFQSLEVELLLSAFLAGETMTSLAIGHGSGLTNLTRNLRDKARNMGMEDQLDAELYRQKCARNTAANAGKKRVIHQLTKEGVFIAEHDSLGSAARALGKTSTGSISNALNPSMDQQLAYGFKWKYK